MADRLQVQESERGGFAVEPPDGPCLGCGEPLDHAATGTVDDFYCCACREALDG